MIDYTSTIVVLSTVYLAISATLFGLRILHPRNRQYKLVTDDIVIAIAFVLLLAVYITFILLAKVGLGKPLSLDQQFSEHEAKSMALLLTAAFATGNAQVFVTKLSIAYTCYRFSRLSEVRTYRIIGKSVLILQIVLLALVVPPMIPCAPLSDMWKDRAVLHCQNFTVLLLTLSGASFANDFILLLAPLPVILQLAHSKTHFRKYRMALWFLLFLGLLVLCGDCVQITYARGYMFGRTSDPVGAHTKQIQASLWFIFRNNIIFIVACLPQARATISHALPRLRAKLLGQNIPEHDIESSRDRAAAELDKVFDSFRAECSSRPSFSPKLNDPSEQGSPREQSSELPHATKSSSSVVIEENPWHGQGLNTNPFGPIAPYSTRVGTWEELYPSESVEIKNFSDQFSHPTLQRPESAFSGRSSLQKDYYDNVQRARQERTSISTRNNSDTLPPEDYIRRTSTRRQQSQPMIMTTEEITEEHN